MLFLGRQQIKYNLESELIHDYYLSPSLKEEIHVINIIIVLCTYYQYGINFH